MPSLFSKPAVAVGVALLAGALAIPIPPATLPEFPWTPCGTNTWCTDIYFCTGPWQNLTTAPIPPTATSGFAYSYRTNLTGDCIPGAAPIFRVQPGQRYKAYFHNTADMDPRFVDPNSTLGLLMTTAWDPTMDPTMNTTGFAWWGQLNLPLHVTNLHLHGAHISGEGDHDNVLRPVVPGMCQMYIWDIGFDTPGGMHIYHPHAHGRVAYQFIGGAFGAWIVEDYNANFQSNGIGKDLKGKVVDQPVKNFLSFRALERVLYAYSEFGTRMGNGDPAGTPISITANQWFRLRVLHAKAEGILGWLVFRDLANLVLAWNTTTSPRCEVYELANDGVYLSTVPYKPYSANGATSQYEYWVHGAERLELAVRCVTSGAFTIDYEGGPVARVTVAPTPVPNPYPATTASPFAAGGTSQWKPNRPNWLSDLRPGMPGYPVEVKTIVQQIIHLGFDGINGILFDVATGPIYSALFDPTIIYEMRYQNTAIHPTHMHLQHQQVVTPGGCGGLKEGEFYDTATTFGPGECLLRTRWINFSGLVIMHCHVLDHEDMGILGYIGLPNRPPGSFEAGPAYSANTKPGYCCVPKVDPLTGQQKCSTNMRCGVNVGINTCNQPCALNLNACPAKTPYCSTTGVCFATIKNADGSSTGPDANCQAPVYPYVVMAVGLAVAAVAVVSAMCIVRKRGHAQLSTILLEEMKQEARQVPTCNYSPFPAHP